MPKPLGNDDLTSRTGLELAADDGYATLGRQHVDSRQVHHLGDGAPRGHADPPPGRPVENQTLGLRTSGTQTRSQLAQQVVGGTVIGLTGVAKATGDGAEGHGRTQGHLADGPHQVEPAVALDVEDQIELARLLVRQHVADLQTSGMEEDVDAAMLLAHLGDRTRDRLCVQEIHTDVSGRAPRSLHRPDSGQRRRGPLEPRKLLLHPDGCCAFTARPEAVEEPALEALRIAAQELEIGVRRIRLGDQVQEIESPTRRRCQIGYDRRDDAPRRAGHHKNRVLPQLHGRYARGHRLFDQTHRPAPARLVTDLDDTGIAERLGHQQLCQSCCRTARPKVDRLDQRIGPLPLEGLGKAHDRTAKRRQGAGFVVAVLTTETGSRYQEGPRPADLLIELPHGGEEPLDADIHGLTPALEREIGEVALFVQCGQPVNPLDRSPLPPVRQALAQAVAIQSRVDDECLDPDLCQLFDEGLADATAIRHHHHTATPAEGYIRRPTALEIGSQNRYRHPAGYRVGGLHVADKLFGFHWRRHRPITDSHRLGDRSLTRRSRDQIGAPVVDKLDGIGQRREVP